MKKNLVISFAIISLLLVGFVSAGFFDNLFTGKAITGNAVWEITEPTGICLGDPTIVQLGEGQDNSSALSDKYSALLNPDCIQSSNQSCSAISGCIWFGRDDFLERINFEVKSGWNLIPGLFYPAQIQNGTVSPENILAIYGIIQASSASDISNFQYIQLFPEFNQSLFREMGFTYEMTMDSLRFNWVYFNKAGNITYRALQDTYNSYAGRSKSFGKGWNFY